MYTLIMSCLQHDYTSGHVLCNASTLLKNQHNNHDKLSELRQLKNKEGNAIGFDLIHQQVPSPLLREKERPWNPPTASPHAGGRAHRLCTSHTLLLLSSYCLIGILVFKECKKFLLEELMVDQDDLFGQTEVNMKEVII